MTNLQVTVSILDREFVVACTSEERAGLIDSNFDDGLPPRRRLYWVNAPSPPPSISETVPHT